LGFERAQLSLGCGQVSFMLLDVRAMHGHDVVDHAVIDPNSFQVFTFLFFLLLVALTFFAEGTQKVGGCFTWRLIFLRVQIMRLI